MNLAKSYLFLINTTYISLHIFLISLFAISLPLSTTLVIYSLNTAATATMTSTATDHLEKSPLHLPPFLPTTSTPSPHLLPRPTPWQRAKAVTHALHGFITSYSTPIEEIDRLLTAVVVLVGCLIQLTCLVAICVWAVAMVVDGVMASYRGCVSPSPFPSPPLSLLSIYACSLSYDGMGMVG